MRYNLLFISILMIIVGCTKPGTNDSSVTQQQIQDLLSYLHTKTTGRGETNCYRVSESDLQNLVHFRQLQGKFYGKDVQLESITPIEWEGLACLYVLQYQKGYEIISADKRSPVPIASNGIGIFISDDGKEGFMGHLDTMAEQIWYSLNGYGYEPDPEWEDEINASLDFWRMVNADRSFVEQSGDRYIDPDAPYGHWELIDIDDYVEEYDTIPHLTRTRWHQLDPYNAYCPKYNPYYLNERCPAGCVAIAGAQMLYYLHGKDGVPVSSPTQGSCTGYVQYNSVVQTFSNPSSSAWSQMIVPRATTDDMAALLVGDVGKRLHTFYFNDSSSAVFLDLADSVFCNYGWDCDTIAGHQASVIVPSLLSGYPVVCAGSREIRGVKRSHAFLIDSYKRSRIKTIAFYEWVIDNPQPGVNYPPVPLRREVTYGTPYVTHYRMNWGQNDTIPNSTWCSLDGVWQYDNYPPYTYNQQMIYHFTLL